MLTNKKIKTDNNNKIFQDIIDFEILKSIINYLLTSKKNKNKNKNNNNNSDSLKNNSNQYNVNKFYLNRNEILNYILVSKKWYNFISLTISNNIINNKSFEYWLKINYNDNKSFIEIYNNQIQYNKNNLIINYKENSKRNKISLNKEFSIIKIKESIINDYFKFNLLLDEITIDDFKEIKKKFENNELLYNRIVVNFDNSFDEHDYQQGILFTIYEYVSKENSEIISNLFKLLELNFHFYFGGFIPKSEKKDDKGNNNNKKCTELYLNNLTIFGNNWGEDVDEHTVKVFKIFKSKNIIYDGSYEGDEALTHVNYSALFDPDNSGQQVESIIVQSKNGNEEFVEARHLSKVNQFENLHSITIPINSFQILSNFSKEFEFLKLYSKITNSIKSPSSKNIKSELYQMVNSFITSKSLKNLKITSPIYLSYFLTFYQDFVGTEASNIEFYENLINETMESISNSFQPLFSELNTSIERIEFDCTGLLNINTFSNLLNNKSIKYLYLYVNSDFIVYSSKSTGYGRGSELHNETLSINQYLFENIFISPLTSIRHYKIKFEELKQLKFIFNLILNNIFKLQLYSLIFEFSEYRKNLVDEFVKEFKYLINNISTQQEQQKLNNINLKEIKIKIKDYEYIQELNNIHNPYFTTIVIRK
ncbi:hypothetical protein ACTFIR_012048 [Dictyostelium discoideum]